MVNDVKYKCHKHPKIVADCTTHRVSGVLLPCADGVDLEGIDGNLKFVVCSSSWGTFIHSLDTHLRQSHIASETPLFFFHVKLSVLSGYWNLLFELRLLYSVSMTLMPVAMMMVIKWLCFIPTSFKQCSSLIETKRIIAAYCSQSLAAMNCWTWTFYDICFFFCWHVHAYIITYSIYNNIYNYIYIIYMCIHTLHILYD